MKKGSVFFILSAFSPIIMIWLKVLLRSSREGLEVTDDVSLVEHLKHPVYITEGSYTNIKVMEL